MVQGLQVERMGLMRGQWVGGVFGRLEFCIFQAEAVNSVYNKGGSGPIECLLLQSVQ